jgi:hypothetical protein
MDFVESDLIYAGLAGMMDPPRKEAWTIPSARCGIRTVDAGDPASRLKPLARSWIGNGRSRVPIGEYSDESCGSGLRGLVVARVTAEHKVYSRGAEKR